MNAILKLLVLLLHVPFIVAAAVAAGAPRRRYRWCEQGFEIRDEHLYIVREWWASVHPDDPPPENVEFALLCPTCYPACPHPDLRGQHGDRIAFGFAPHLNIAAGTWASSADDREDLRALGRLHLLKHRKVIERRAAEFGWDSLQMHAYIHRVLRGCMTSNLARKHGWCVEQGSESLAVTNAEDGSDFEPESLGTDAAGSGVIAVDRWSGPEASAALDPGLDIQRAIAALPEPLRRVFEARYTEDGETRPWADVEQLTGIPERTARRYLNTATEQLRAQLA